MSVLITTDCRDNCLPVIFRRILKNLMTGQSRILLKFFKKGEPGGTDMAKLKLDLHDIYNKGDLIEKSLGDIIEEAIERKIPLVEIIPGKGSGQLKKKVIRYLQSPEVKKLYHRMEKDSKNFGRIFIHFRY